MTTGVVSFDLDGTLITGPFGGVLADLRHPRVPRIKARAMERHRALLAVDPLAAYDWEAIVAAVLAEAGVEESPDLVGRLHARLGARTTRVLHDRTVDCFAAFHAAGWRVVVLTNGWRRYQEPVLAQLGLLNEIDQLLTADDIGAPKPARAAFAAARGGADRHVHVGDRLDHDVAGGNAAGATTVLLRADVPVVGPCRCVGPKVSAYLRASARDATVAAPEVSADVPVPHYLARSLSDLTSAPIWPAVLGG